MAVIESNPEMAAAVYATMARNLSVVRRRLGRPLTLADKILLGHLDDPEHQEIEPGKSYLLLRPDRVVFQDVLGQTGLLQFMQTRRQNCPRLLWLSMLLLPSLLPTAASVRSNLMSFLSPF